jgi:hypothetical protein
MKHRNSARAAVSRSAWRITVARLLWGMLVLYEAMEERLD